MILQITPPPPPNGWMGQAPFDAGPCEGFSCIPIDQGALLIIAIGLVIGIYTLIKEHKNKRNGR